MPKDKIEYASAGAGEIDGATYERTRYEGW